MLKKSQVVAGVILVFILISLLVKFLVIKLEAEKQKILWEKNVEYLKQLENNCFFVKKAYLIRDYENNKTILYIKLPKYILPLNYKNLYFNSEGVFLKKVVNKIYLDRLELTQYQFFLSNVKICVE